MKKLLEAFKWINLGLLFGNICPFLTISNGVQWKITQRKSHFWLIFFLNSIMSVVHIIAGLLGFILADDLITKWNVQIALTFISLVVPGIIYQVNIIAIFVKGEEHATVFRMFAKFEQHLNTSLKMCLDLTLWQKKMLQDCTIVLIYWAIVFVLKSVYNMIGNNWIFVYYTILGLIDLTFLIIVCHIRSIVRCLRIFQRQLLTIFRSLRTKRDFRNFYRLNRELMDVKRYIDRTFGPLLLINIAYDFVALIFQIYFYSNYLLYFDFGGPHVAQILKIAGFAYKAVAAITEMEAFYTEVKALRNDFRKARKNIPDCFFYQNLHENNWEYFTAAQFFDLNYILITNFFGGCLMYIVIMFQFDLLEKSI
uniref:Gustatory receptor n=1 Tax=Lutzomyia longipalpis TaxID=7200 RepID=A0A3F2ZD87_LUTLO